MEKMNYLLPEESGEMTLSGITTLRKMEQKLRNLFESQNYQEGMPPNFEYVELYTGLDAGFEQEKMFQFINHEGKSIALRYDFTVPLARNFALSELKEARYSYFGKVFRKEKRHKGRRTESYQVGTELLGLSEVTGDQEILGLTFMTLEALTLKNTIVEIGSAAFFKRLCELSGGDAPLFSELLEKKSLSGMKAFVDKHEMRGAPRDLLLTLMTTTDLPTMKKLVLATGDEKLSQALEMLEALNLPDKTAICQIHYDFAMVPAMGYYTGLMFQVYVEGVAQAVISGGRYDKLLKQFGKTTGSIGFCVHMDNVMKGLNND